jgi:hypothetical protein
MDEDVDCVVISMRVVDVINGPTYTRRHPHQLSAQLLRLPISRVFAEFRGSTQNERRAPPYGRGTSPA